MFTYEGTQVKWYTSEVVKQQRKGMVSAVKEEGGNDYSMQ